MAWGKGTETKESVEFKRYVGTASCKILAVNPSKQELEKIYNTDLDKEPEYIFEKERDGKMVKSVKIDFIAHVDENVHPEVNLTTKITFFLRNELSYNKDKTKVKVIDKYGRTAWVTVEQAKAKEIPMYSNGPANIDKDYRPCFIGEEELCNFLKTYLGIKNVMKYVNNSWVMVDNPEECEARLDKIQKYFTGDFSELKATIGLQPNNSVVALFGIQSTDSGSQYQAVYTGKFLKATMSNIKGTSQEYEKLVNQVKEDKDRGAYSSVEFEVCPIKEYSVTPTSFEDKSPFESNSDLPFTQEEEDKLPW